MLFLTLSNLFSTLDLKNKGSPIFHMTIKIYLFYWSTVDLQCCKYFFRLFSLCVINFICLFMATPTAYGNSHTGVESELQLPAYTTAKTTWDLSHVCNLHHSSQQCWLFNPLSKPRDGTHILMDTSQVHYHRAMMRTPSY